MNSTIDNLRFLWERHLEKDAKMKTRGEIRLVVSIRAAYPLRFRRSARVRVVANFIARLVYSSMSVANNKFRAVNAATLAAY
jgi:hypothetical protein